MRILHVLQNLEVGGIQKWVAHLAQAPRPQGMSIDIVVLRRPVNEELAAVIQNSGCGLFILPKYGRLFALWKVLSRARAEAREYGVVHAHIYYIGGIVLWVCRLAGIPVRIQHIHSVMSRPDLRLTALNWRWWTLGLLRYLIRTSATRRLAVSKSAGASMFGSAWPTRPGDKTVSPSIPCPILISAARKYALRQEFGLPEEAIVVGHIGRLVPIKNHPHLLRVFQALRRDCAVAWLLLVGDGPEQQRLNDLAKALHISDRIIWAGKRGDATDILQLFDVAVLPSFSEAFPIFALESQALGVPMVASLGAPTEPFEANTCYFKRVALDAPINEWMHAIKEALQQKSDRVSAQAAFARSKLEIGLGQRELIDIYHDDGMAKVDSYA